MRRRAILRAAGTAGVLGLSGASGCIRTVADRFSSYGRESEWRYNVGGYIDAVSNGYVFGRQTHSSDRGEGSVFALDAETGRTEWTYGRTHGYSQWTDLTVADAVYFGSRTHTPGSRVYEVTAMEFGGKRRWTHATRSVYTPPRLADGTVYAGSGLGVVRAFDAETGEVRWQVDVGDGEPHVDGVDSSVYVTLERELRALDPTDGTRHWRYGCADRGYHAHTSVSDGVAYVDCHDRRAAVVDGEPRWGAEREGSLRAVGPDHLLVENGDRLQALSLPDGEQRWSSGPAEVPRVRPFAYRGDTLYYGGTELSAVDTSDWSERWSTSVGQGEPVESITVTDRSGRAGSRAEDDHAVVAAGGNWIATVDPGGEQHWTDSVDGDVWDVVIGGRVFVSTEESVYALDPSTETPSD